MQQRQAQWKQAKNINSLAPGKFECNFRFRYLILQIISVIDGWGISCELALRLTSLNLTDDKSTLVQVMAWCRQATSHYLSQRWPRSLSPYGITRPQWVESPPLWTLVFLCYSFTITGSDMASGEKTPSLLSSCGICTQPYDDDKHQAKFLSCDHTFCSHCLSELRGNKGGTRRRDPNSIKCPNCNKITHLPYNGITGLQTKFYVESKKELSEKTELPKPAEQNAGCQKHRNEPIFFFCETCRMAICRNCTVLDHKETAGHIIISIDVAETACRSTLRDQLHTSRRSQTRIQRSIQHVENQMKQIHDKEESAVKDLESFIQSAYQQLQQCHQEAADVISRHHKAQLSNWQTKQRQLQETTEMLAKPITQSEEIMKTGDISEVIDCTVKLKKATQNTESCISGSGQTDKCFMPDSASEDSFNDRLHHIGKKCFQSFFPTNVVFQIGEIVAGFKSTITIKLVNNACRQVPFIASFLTVEIRDPEHKELEVSFSTTYPKCIVKFTPQRSGLHQISATYLNQCKQSDISVSSNNPVLKFGFQWKDWLSLKLGLTGNTDGILKAPRGIAIDKNNYLYVADTGNQMIQKFTTKGQFLSQFSVNSHGEESSTTDLAIDSDKGLIVCNEIKEVNFLLLTEHRNTNELSVFDLAGNLLDEYTCNEVTSICGIAINSHGDIIICDKKSLYRKDKHRNVFRLFSSRNIIDGPGYYLCIDGDDNVILAETKSNVVKIFNPNGSHKITFCVSLNDDKKKGQPFGVASDGEHILVADDENKCIKVFKYNGTFVSTIESTNDPLSSPRGLAVTKDGFVFVADRDNACIKKYRYRDMRKMATTLELRFWN